MKTQFAFQLWLALALLFVGWLFLIMTQQRIGCPALVQGDEDMISYTKEFEFDPEMYTKNILKCPTPPYNESDDLLPDKIKKNHPRQPYPECGVNGLLRPWNSKLHKQGWMLFMVKSAPSHFVYRQLIREYWGAVKQVKGVTFTTIFVISRASSDDENLLKFENDAFGDILQCNHLDSYRNLTIKIFSGFRWILASGMSYDHVTFCDDDSVMNIAEIFYYFKMSDHKNDVVCGYKISDQESETVDRGNTSKWYIPMDLYDKETYPRFCHGAMWTITPRIMHELYCAAETTNLTDLYVDDVISTGILRYKAGIPHNRVVSPENEGKIELSAYAYSSNKIHVIKILALSQRRKLTESYFVKTKYFHDEPMVINPNDVVFEYPNNEAFHDLEKKWLQTQQNL